MMTTTRVAMLAAALAVSCVPRFEGGIWCDDDESCPASLVCRCNRCVNPLEGPPPGCNVGGGAAGGGSAGGPVCIPTTCQALGATCGAPANGCGSPLFCGTCTDEQFCDATNRCVVDVSLAQVRAVLAATPDDGGVARVSLPVTNVLVTAFKPQVPGASSTDGPGFFAQAQSTGLFIEAPVTPGPSVGDLISFTATRVARVNGHRRVLEVSGFSRSPGDGGLPGFVQVETFDAEFLRRFESVMGGYTTRLTSVVAPDAGYVVAEADAGRTLIRLPVSLNDTEDLRPGCALVARGPIWLTPEAVHIDAYEASALRGVQCPPPLLVSAAQSGQRQVRVTTSRWLNPTPVDNTRFQVREAGSAMSAFSITGVSRPARDVVEVFTSTPFRPGFEYEVGVSATPPTDVKGVPVPSTSAAPFVAGGCATQARVIISAVSVFNADGEWVELHNRTSTVLPLGGWVLGVRTTLGNRAFEFPPATTMPPGSYLLVQVNTRPNGFLVQPDLVASTLTMQSSGSVVFLGPPRTAGCDDAMVEDKVAFGTPLTGCAETPQLASPTTGQMLKRADGRGCVDTSSNASNFAQVPLSAPRSAATRSTTCLCP
jgi:hypothetical protein